jgi:hypothetical protein
MDTRMTARLTEEILTKASPTMGRHCLESSKMAPRTASSTLGLLRMAKQTREILIEASLTMVWLTTASSKMETH